MTNMANRGGLLNSKVIVRRVEKSRKDLRTEKQRRIEVGREERREQERREQERRREER